jgi:hypothetical protein
MQRKLDKQGSLTIQHVSHFWDAISRFPLLKEKSESANANEKPFDNFGRNAYSPNDQQLLEEEKTPVSETTNQEPNLVD